MHQDVNRLPSNKEQTSAGSATNIGLNMSNILAFAQVNPSAKDLFNKDTKCMWSCTAKQKAAQAKTIIKIHLDHLIQEDASFSLCIHSQLLDTLVNVLFKPGDMFSSKPHLGLSILAFVPRKLKEIKGLAHQTKLIERATVVTTEDTNKTKLGAPLLLNMLSKIIEALKQCATFIEFVLGPECP